MAKVWECWNSTKDISGWAFASDDWEANSISNDLRVGGTFKTIMSAKDGSKSFPFAGTYTLVKKHERIEYNFDDGRHVVSAFKETLDGVVLTETFDPEAENSPEVQRTGWQGILDSFKKYVENKKD